jgi:sodium transport system ATP-binding protein
MIVAEHLRKTFPGKGKKAAPVIAVDDVSFTAHDGQITGLLGPNGAGKTTTMRMLYTLMQPEKGRVLVDGIDVGQDAGRGAPQPGRVARRARRVQAPDRAREHRLLRRAARPEPGAGRRAHPHPGRSAADGSDVLDRQCEGFSQGQRTKTAIARALVHDPRNVILDEPTNGLDVMTTRACATSCKQLRDGGALRDLLQPHHAGGRRAVRPHRHHRQRPGDGRGHAEELRAKAGIDNLEDAFVRLIGSEEGLHA